MNSNLSPCLSANFSLLSPKNSIDPEEIIVASYVLACIKLALLLTS